jgi:hypothetical protein
MKNQISVSEKVKHHIPVVVSLKDQTSISEERKPHIPAAGSLKNQLSIPEKRMNHIPAMASFVALVLLAGLSIYQQQRPPSAVPVEAAATDFSSARALKHIAAIAKQTHPIGSAQHDEVRDYILNELRSAGLTPEIQKTTSINANRGEAGIAGTVQNILARLPGTSSTKAVLLMGHYDSVPNSHGAADDGAAVGAMLETLRALKANSPLKNDTIFLFTDGEEVGLLGAIAFVKEHPWVKDIGLVLNFEARGSSGPSFMFETSNGNRWLIEQFAKAAPYPVSNSLLYEIYRALPNDTDLSPLKQAGVPGLNFAFIDDEANYHSPNDRIETLDPRSLQHHGSYALALTRHFGNLSLETRKESNAVYFNTFGAHLVHYSVAWVLPLAALTLVAFTFVVVMGLKRKRLSFRGMVMGWLFFLLSLIISALTLTIVWWLIGRRHPEYGAQLTGATYRSGLYMIGFAALTVAVSSLLYAWFNKKVAVENLFAGALFWWLLLCVLTGLFLPGVSYIFTWPLLFVLLGFGYVLRANEQLNTKGTLILAASAVAGVLLLAPAIHLIFVALTISLSGVAAILIVLLLGLLVPLICRIAAANKWLLPGVSALIGVIYIVFAGWTSVPSERQPNPDNVFYCLDAGTGKAVWASVDPKPDEFTANFFTAGMERGKLTECLPQSSRTFLKSAAPAASLEAPGVELIDDQKSDDKRKLQLRLTSPRGANAISIFFDPDAEIVNASINDKPALSGRSATAKQGWFLIYYALPPEGVVLKLETKSPKPLHARAVDLSYGLPTLPNAASPKRPPYLIPSMYFVSDAALVSKSFTF